MLFPRLRLTPDVRRMIGAIGAGAVIGAIGTGAVIGTLYGTGEAPAVQSHGNPLVHRVAVAPAVHKDMGVTPRDVTAKRVAVIRRGIGTAVHAPAPVVVRHTAPKAPAPKPVVTPKPAPVVTPKPVTAPEPFAGARRKCESDGNTWEVTSTGFRCYGHTTDTSSN